MVSGQSPKSSTRRNVVPLDAPIASELTRWCREAGLSAQGFKGMGYNPLSQRYSLSDDTSVNYLLACRAAA